LQEDENMSTPTNNDVQSTATPLSEEDPLLQHFVRDAPDDGDGLQVTLLVGGALVAGRLVSARRYFTLLAEQWGEASGHPVETTTYLQPLIDASPRRDERADKPGPRFIHLHNARTFAGVQVTTPGLLWRGKLAAVDAMFFGELGPKPLD
jgi:hypothetical protein